MLIIEIIVGFIAFCCFMCLYEHISGKDKMPVKGLAICSVLGISMVITFFVLSGTEFISSLVTLIIIIIIIIIIIVICSCIPKDKREKITSNVFNQVLVIRKYDALWNKREEYLKVFDKDEEYFILKKFYDQLNDLISNYKREILHAPLKLTKPVSPYTAAYFGTMIGGAAVGVVAAQNAVEREKAYQKNVIDVVNAELKKGNAHDKVEYCYQSIEAILSKNEYTYNNWNKEKQLVEDEMDKKYKIVAWWQMKR